MATLAAEVATPPVEEIGTDRLLLALRGKRTVRFPRRATIYLQGDHADSAFRAISGTVLLTIVSPSGKEVVVEIVSPGDFFGENCIFDQEFRTSSAIALEPVVATCIDKQEMRSLMRRSTECAEEFMRHLGLRNHRIQEHLTDQLFHTSELRLARTLRLLARRSEAEEGKARLPRISQSLLAEIVGTTRSRVSYFLLKFRRMGMVDYDKGLRVNTEMIDALLRE